MHEALNFFGIVLLLHCVLDILHEVLDGVLVFFSNDLCFFALFIKLVFGFLLGPHILLHL